MIEGTKSVAEIAYGTFNFQWKLKSNKLFLRTPFHLYAS